MQTPLAVRFRCFRQLREQRLKPAARVCRTVPGELLDGAMDTCQIAIRQLKRPGRQAFILVPSLHFLAAEILGEVADFLFFPIG